MKLLYSTITERGQTSVPALLRKLFGLRAGQRLIWQTINDKEIRVTVDAASASCLGPAAMLGYALKFNPQEKRGTDEIMRELRAGEK